MPPLYIYLKVVTDKH